MVCPQLKSTDSTEYLVESGCVTLPNRPRPDDAKRIPESHFAFTTTVHFYKAGHPCPGFRDATSGKVGQAASVLRY